MVIDNDGTLSQVRGRFACVPPGIFMSCTAVSAKKTPPAPRPRRTTPISVKACLQLEGVVDRNLGGINKVS